MNDPGTRDLLRKLAEAVQWLGRGNDERAHKIGLAVEAAIDEYEEKWVSSLEKWALRRNKEGDRKPTPPGGCEKFEGSETYCLFCLLDRASHMEGDR